MKLKSTLVDSIEGQRKLKVNEIAKIFEAATGDALGLQPEEKDPGELDLSTWARKVAE